MDKGYVENGFIVDLSNARKTSEIIYELSRILDIPEAQNKQVCLKLGNVALTQTELTSIKALVESMNSEIEFISTNAPETIDSAKSLNIEISELENIVEAPDFEMTTSISPEVENALDKIFGDNDFEKEEEAEKEKAEKNDRPEE